MQQIPEPIKRTAAPSPVTGVQETDKRSDFFQIARDWVSVNSEQKNLRKMLEFIEEMKLSLLQSPEEGVEVEFSLMTPEMVTVLQKKFPQKWQVGSDAVLALLDFDKALKAKNPHAAEALVTFASRLFTSPLSPPVHLMRAMNTALLPMVTVMDEDKERVGGYTAKLCALAATSAAVKKWGASLHQVKDAVFGQLEAQALASPPTPFSQEAQLLLNTFVQNPDTFQSFVDQAEELKKENLQKLQALLQNVSGLKDATPLKNSILKSNYATAAAEEVSYKQALYLLSDISDQSYHEVLLMLSNVLELLKKGFPKDLPKELQAFVDQLEKLLNDYNKGKVNWADLTTFSNNLLKYLATTIGSGNLDQKTTIAVLTNMCAAFEKIMAVIQSGDPALQNPEIKALIETYKALKACASDIAILTQLIAKLQKGFLSNLTAEDWVLFANTYLDLLNRVNSPNIDPKIKELLNTLTTQLAATKVGPDLKYTLMDVLATSLIYSWAPDKASNFEDVKTAINKKIEEIVQAAKTNPALKSLADALDKMRIKSPNDTGAFGLPLFIIDGFNTVHRSDISGNAWNFPIPEEALEKLGAEIAALSKKIASTLENIKPEAEAYIEALNQLESIKGLRDQIQAVIADLKIKIRIYSDSLPDAFFNLVIQEFMGKQEAIMQRFALMLYFGNMAGGMFNDLKNVLGPDFANSTQYINLDAWIKQQKPPPTADQIKDHAKTERDKAQSMADKSDKAVTQIDDDITKIANDPQMTADQKAEATKALVEKRGALVEKSKSLHALVGTMQNILDGKSYDLGKIKEAEDLINNGNPSGKPPIPGMNDIVTDISNLTQKYTSQGGLAQIQLMMTMTGVQQEWTLVANCLQSLNQMYMAPIRGIQGH